MALELDEIMPHRGRIRMVTELESADDREARFSGVVQPSWPGWDGTGIRPAVLLEFLAQCAGALMGAREARAATPGGRGGVLVGISRATLALAPVPGGTRLEGRVRLDRMAEGRYLVFVGTVSADGADLAEAELQALRADEGEFAS